MTKCPFCSYPLPSATGVNNDKPPEAGDISICIKCGTFLKFHKTKADLGLKILTKEELEEIRKEDPESAELLFSLYQMIKDQTKYEQAN